MVSRQLFSTQLTPFLKNDHIYLINLKFLLTSTKQQPQYMLTTWLYWNKNLSWTVVECFLVPESDTKLIPRNWTLNRNDSQVAFGLFLENGHESVLGFFLADFNSWTADWISFIFFKVLIELNWRIRVITILFFFLNYYFFF